MVTTRRLSYVNMFDNLAPTCFARQLRSAVNENDPDKWALLVE